MGYYSLYKILKDILLTILKNKTLRRLLIIISLGFLFLLLKGSPVFAAEINIGGVDFNFNDSITDKTNIIITGVGFNPNQPTSSTITVYCTNSDIVGTLDSNNQLSTVGPSSSADPLYYRIGLISSFSGWNVTSFSKVNYSNTVTIDTNGSNSNILYCNCDVYKKNDTSTVIYSGSNKPILDPEILNPSSELENLIFDVLRINARSYSQDNLYLLCYDKNYQGVESYKNLYPIKEFLLNQSSKYFVPERTTDVENSAVYWINRDELGFNWAIGNIYSFKFAIRVDSSSEFSDWEYEYIGNEFVFTISNTVLPAQIEDLNEQTKETIEAERHEQTINSIDNINNSITDPTIENSSIELPSDDTTDITKDGIDNIFAMIYNGFTTGNPSDIVIPMGPTNKTVTISAHYLENIMNENNFSLLAYYIRVFYWYSISAYIVKDIMAKIQKIKAGDIEHVEETNIKGEML